MSVWMTLEALRISFEFAEIYDVEVFEFSEDAFDVIVDIVVCGCFDRSEPLPMATKSLHTVVLCGHFGSAVCVFMFSFFW